MKKIGKPTLVEVLLIVACIVLIAITANHIYTIFNKRQPTKSTPVQKVENTTAATADNKNSNNQPVKTMFGGIEYDFANVNAVKVTQ